MNTVPIIIIMRAFTLSSKRIANEEQYHSYDKYNII